MVTAARTVCRAARGCSRTVGRPTSGRGWHGHGLAGTRHDRPGSRSLDDAAQLGGVGPLLRGEGLQRDHPDVPRLRGGGRGVARGPDADRDRHRSVDRRAHCRGDHGARPAADHHRPLVRRDAHAAPARPRLRGRGRRDRLRADGGRARRSALADQVAVPRAQGSAQPPQGGRLHARRVPLRVHEHVERRTSRRRSTTGTTSRRPATGSGPTASSPTSSPATRRPG